MKNMAWFGFILLTGTILGCDAFNSTPKVQFTNKFVGQSQWDFFGASIATVGGQLIVGASAENEGKGAVHVGLGWKIEPPASAGGKGFGSHVHSNKEYIVVSGFHTDIYVYEANPPYGLKARLPADGDFIRDVVIGTDNAIAAVRGPHHSNTCYLMIYSYDTHSNWHLNQKLHLGKCPRSPDEIPFRGMAISGNTLAVNMCEEIIGRVELYRNFNGVWSKNQTIFSPPDEEIHFFGYSLAIDGDHLVLSSQHFNEKDGRWDVLFTYHLDPVHNVWVKNSQWQAMGAFTAVAIRDNVIVATVNPYHETTHENVCAVVYKLSLERVNTWEEFAILRTNGEQPRKPEDWHIGVTIQEGLVYTGLSPFRNAAGMVFVHNIHKMLSNAKN